MRNTTWRWRTVADRWTVHSYYTTCPYAPDGSGRLLVAGADLDRQPGEVLVLANDGTIQERFGSGPVTASFWHTGFWQTWSPDARYVYFQSGPLAAPQISRYELATRELQTIAGDMEGAPPFGEPILSGLLGMLYAAGYGTERYEPDRAPVAFQQRDRHGLFQYTFEPPGRQLRLSVAEILARHPQRDQLQAADRDLQTRLGSDEGLTLMSYCVRWNRTGSRCLFYFGNHCVVPGRGEPRLASIFTADRNLGDVQLAVDLSFGRRGVHWSWHPDGEHLIGYGPDPADPRSLCLAQVRYDGTDYRRISRHASGGHPSISPADHQVLVTDESTIPGRVVFIDLRTDTEIAAHSPGRVFGNQEPPGRNPLRVCHHPVFNRAGTAVLVNALPGRLAQVCEIPVPGGGA